MAKGSQLSQLKNALSQAGLSKQQQQQKNGKKRKRSVLDEKEKQRKAAKLKEIQQKMNPFDVKVTKLKHDVGGRRIAGTVGRPAQSKQAGIERRKKTLLKEFEDRDHAGGILDRRFGENDPTMTPEERMLERFTRERQRNSRGDAYNLEDDDELTHYGQSLSNLDDFDNVGLRLEEEEEDQGHIDRRTVHESHFGGFDDEDDDDEDSDGQPQRKKSKAEVMSEVMAKSKEYKFARQAQQEEDVNLRHQLDEELDTLRSLLYAPDPSLKASDRHSLEEKPSSAPAAFALPTDEKDQEYDQFVRELAFEKRAQPKDRTKTEEELAVEEKEALEKAEKQRLRRMQGLEDIDDDEDRGGKGRRRQRGGDDLDDDFVDEENTSGVLGAGLEGQEVEEDSEDSEDDDEGGGEEGDLTSEDSEEEGDNEAEESESETLVKTNKYVTNSSGKTVDRKELPYTFPCPGTHDEFLEIIEDVEDADLSTVVKRIRTLYHPSLAQDNKFKLQALTGVLIDHILYITSPPTPKFTLLASLIPHLYALSKSFPTQSAKRFVEKLNLMQKNLKRGLSHGVTESSSKTWPGLAELSLLRVTGLIWPTSDMNHPVISPARLLMGSYLGLCRVRSLQDIASGLFLCTLFLQYEGFSKRLVPEAITFLYNAILHLAPNTLKDESALPGCFPAPDFRSDRCMVLAIISGKATKRMCIRKPDLTRLLAEGTMDEQAKVDLLGLTLELMNQYADLYKGFQGFVELFEPATALMDSVKCDGLPHDVTTKLSSTKDMLGRLLKFSHLARRPLVLQAHKAIPIATYIPRFEHSSSNYLRNRDPDHERNESAKLRAQYKQEKKGAIRELRKDARFLAAEQQKKEKEKDQVYNERMKKVYGSLESERAEQKAMDKEKMKDKKRSGRNLAYLGRLNSTFTCTSYCVVSRDCRVMSRSLKRVRVTVNLDLRISCLTTRLPCQLDRGRLVLHAFMHSPTPLPLPTFYKDGPEATAADLLELLQNVQKQFASNGSQGSQHDAYLLLLEGLNDHFLRNFPSSRNFLWTTLHEKAKVMEVALESIPVAVARVPEILHGSDKFIKSLIIRLLDFCHVLDLWMDVPDIPVEDDYPLPSALRSKAVDATVAILRCLGNSVKRESESKISAGWEVLRSLVTECIEGCAEILSTLEIDKPLSLRLYVQPRVVVTDDAKKSGLTNFFIEISGQAQYPLITSSLLDILLSAFYPTLLSQPLLADILYRLVVTAQRTYRYLTSPACRTTAAIRVRSICRLVGSLTRAVQHSPELATIGETIRLNSLLARINDGPIDAWGNFDDFLQDILAIELPAAISAADVKSVATALCLNSWGDDSQSLRRLCRVYVRTCLQQLKTEALLDMQHMLSSIEHTSDGAELLAVINARLDMLTASTACEDDVMDVEPGVQSWRGSVRAVTQAIVEPDDLAWMDDDETLNDTHYLARAVTDIATRFERPLYNPSAPSRLALTQELLRLPCALARHLGLSCPVEPGKFAVNAIHPSLLLSPLILEGPEEEVTAVVRKAVYDALARSINHQTAAYGGGKLEHAGQLAARGMKDNDRSVRLSAGRCLVELVKLYQRLGGHHTAQTDPIFTAISSIFAKVDIRHQETALITCGSIAKIATPDIFFTPLTLLLSMLGRSNPVLKGTAYMQLCAVAKHHKKSHYNLFAPYMDRIAPFLVTRICKQPSALNESCRFLSVAPHDFVNVTLNHTLPHIFSNHDRQTLEAVSAATQKKCHSLFLTHESKILARAFMAPKPGQTRAILTFITSVLTDAASGGTIDIDSVIKSCLVNLIAELVMYMGDDDPAVVDEAIHAVMKIEAIVTTKSTTPHTAAAGDETVSKFLQPYMLGIITHLNDVLQDKQPVDMKRRVIRSLGAFMNQIGPAISNVAPQILATLQSTLVVDALAEVTIESWDIFLRKLDVHDVGSYIGPTSASVVTFWPTFSIRAKDLAKRCLEHVVLDVGDKLAQTKKLDELVDFSAIPELKPLYGRVAELKGTSSGPEKLQTLLGRITNDNLMVVARALEELRSFLVNEEGLVRELASGDVFDPLIGETLSALLTTTARDGEGTDVMRSLAFECIGALGALDPDRLEFGESDARMVVTSNFTDDTESATFVVHLIKDVLVGAFRSTSDTQYQTQIAYTIQELLKFCSFTSSLITPGSSASVPLKVRNRWNALPKQVIETITPLLASRYTLNVKPAAPTQYPIYPIHSTYREWISVWTSNLLTQVSGTQARNIFSVFAAVVRNRDVGVAHHLLPHLVLNILVSGKQEDADNIRLELLSVLQDQVDPSTKSTADKRDLSAQTVFLLMDHLNKWVRVIRQELNTGKPDGRKPRSHQPNGAEDQLVRVDSIVSSIEQNLMARAALRCKAYARALMSFEQQVIMMQGTKDVDTLSNHYERLHEIYAQLDEPDGMEGITTLILSPSLEHQIRQHESTGRWTAAQSCWEVQLQRAPDELRSHLGLLRCLKNVGHYDTLRTHVEGVLHRRPDWEAELVGYQVESACMVSKWDEVQALVATTEATSSSVLMAKVLLAMRSGHEQAISTTLSDARRSLGAPIAAAGSRGYRRSYEAVLDLHLLHELRVIYDHITSPFGTDQERPSFTLLDKQLSARLESIQPSFRFREPIISMRRTALALRTRADIDVVPYIGQSWLLSAKLARKAGYTQTAYSAVLQSQQLKTPFSFIESAKLTRVTGEPLRALRELENSLSLTARADNVIDLTVDDGSKQRLRAKAFLMRAKWMRDSDRFDVKDITVLFEKAREYRKQWESGLFHLGQFQDECFKNLDLADRASRGEIMNLNTIKCFGEAIAHGDKYIYQTVPRLLTLWLDMGETHKNAPDHKATKKATAFLMKHARDAPTYKWYTAFPQIVSRIGHPSGTVWPVLQGLIIRVIREYPRQALWGFASAIHAKERTVRHERAKAILDKVKNQSSGQTQDWILATVTMTQELLALCNLGVKDDKKSLSMSRDFPSLQKLAPSELIIPLQESLTASLPPTAALSRDHEPFPSDAPKFHKFFDEIDIMRSLARPRKLTIQGTNGQIYMFLGKPKDDLRKDARLMDFNAIINKLLKSNSDSRRRQLRIRTYGIVTLNEECGFIQWVPNTIPVRPVLLKLYEARNIRSWSTRMGDIFEKIKLQPENEAAKTFEDHILTIFPPVFHEWFIETFPEPSAWLASRLAYSRTTAVMCMVGFILGLGDRHCENILLDTNSGDLVHVDFNCLFEKGKTLETPERVPFRLTQNIVDGFGITGVEGVFRIACEITMQLLRDNKDCLMSVLDAFIHDPLVEWEDEQRRMSRRAPRKSSRTDNNVAASVDLKQLAKNALNPIEKKLKGIYSIGKEKSEKEISTSSLVQVLIEESMDLCNLSKMYPGWAPWH